jgi:hydrogenase assembly chaperone HypC/HupF
MCIALPRKVVAIADPDRLRVVVDDGKDRETVSAALVADGGLEALLGRHVVAHAGFVLEVLDEADARSRLSVFAALDGDTTPLDLSDLRAARSGGEPDAVSPADEHP